ncbi:chlorophyll synthesis pathway protein BchC [Elioraea rosea]|uniref:chlorophyll synthesis pathway protein BchC n=1 Tax=Elioraea rosea TaxID=2492390 RepID=UPI0011842B72|nr:chlorophyll synthesis pathway protein BchC [Elioraea rosea]
MDTLAVLLKAPQELALSRLPLVDPGEDDVVVDVEWSGISTGTERLLYTGRMPPFPGMGYPLVPGYESVGRVVEAGPRAGRDVGARVFVPGARCFGPVRGLFGGAAQRLVVPGTKVRPIDERLEERGVLLALAATARHALAAPGAPLPELIVGHGVLGRLIARLVLALDGKPPTVWETNPVRADGAEGYSVVDPIEDERRDYRCVIDVSGDATILDTLVARLAPGGEVVLAGFYSDRLSFAFPPAFMREARLRVAAEWREGDIEAVTALIAEGRLSLDGLITHHEPAERADAAYRTAFGDPACLKMILDWRACP